MNYFIIQMLMLDATLESACNVQLADKGVALNGDPVATQPQSSCFVGNGQQREATSESAWPVTRTAPLKIVT